MSISINYGSNLKRNNNYLLITPSIANLGGAQLYILRRAKYLSENGYAVKIIVSTHNPQNFILENQFERIPVLFLKDLQKPFSLYSIKKLDRIIQNVKSFLSDVESGIIETSSLETAVWGELFAKTINWKHIIYLLADPKISQYIFYPGYHFFEYKLNKRELYGTAEQTLPLIFGKPVEKDKNLFVNVPFDTGELAELSVPPGAIRNIGKNSFVIGTICRLEKTYLKPFIDSCIYFAEKHKKKSITLIVAGGSEKPKLFNQLKDLYSNRSLNISNLIILFPGYIKVLGKDFFNALDVFVGMGTASINAISQSCATLNIDPITNQCSGIFGIDINNFGYPQNGIIFKIEDKLEELMLDPEIMEASKLKGLELFLKEYSVESSFKKLEFLINFSADKFEYYPFRFSFFIRLCDNYKFLLGLVKSKIYRMLIFFKSFQFCKSSKE